MEKKDNTKYDLTKEEYNKCLARAELHVFMKAIQSDNPKSVFVVAQPGAGKTGLRNFVVNEAQDDRTLTSHIEFNPDEIAIHHTYYSEILEEFPDESYQILQRFVLPALDGFLRKRAVELKNNIVQEGTFGATEGYIKILDFQKNGGDAQIGKLKEDGSREIRHVDGNYYIDINVLAVDRFESLLSSYEREQYFREAGMPPRVVTKENHDSAYEKILNTLRVIENKKLFDRIRVFKRGYSIDRPELVYISGDNRYSNSVEALISERAKNRKELLNNPEGYLERIDKLLERANKLQISSQISRIESLKEEFLKEVEKEKIQNK